MSNQWFKGKHGIPLTHPLIYGDFQLSFHKYSQKIGHVVSAEYSVPLHIQYLINF